MQSQASHHSQMPAITRLIFALVDLPHPDVIEEHQRVATGGEDVVDVHRHQILAGDLELVVVEQQAQLGADAVRTGDDDRLVVGAEVVARGEQAEGLEQLALALGARSKLADVTYQGRRLVDVDASFFVGE